MNEGLSVCIIVRDEERSIKNCIDSIKNIADELIVVDTGSIDNTVEIVRDLGAIIYEYKWNNDYSKARNFALDKCTKEWVFVIDGDETLEKGYDKLLKELIESTDKEAIYLQVNNFVGAQIVNEELKLRLFRNKKEYRYINKFYEEIFTSIKNNSGADSFESTYYIINHFGTDEKEVNTKEKLERNLEVLKSYKEEERDANYYVGLANIYCKNNDYEKSGELFRKAVSIIPKNHYLRVFAIVGLCNSNYKCGKYITALNYIDKYLKEIPKLKELYFLKSACNNELMRYSRSFIALNMFKAIPKDIKKYPNFNFDMFNDIDSLVLILGALRVSNPPNLLTVIIEVNSKLSQFEDVIKNVNEISEDVIVVNCSEEKEIIDKAFELGATIYCNVKKDNKNWEYKISKKAKGKWMLFLDQNRVINYEERSEIVKLIKECEKENVKEINLKYRLIKKNAIDRIKV